jgi:hypothetical protein
MSFKTNDTIIVDYKDFYIGANQYNSTGTANNEVKIVPSDSLSASFQGPAIDIEGDYVVIGADAANSAVGAAYLYDITGNLVCNLVASDGAVNDRFGWSVAIHKNRVVVGAYADDDLGSVSGSAYLYDLQGNQLKKLLADDGALGDFFGYRVAAGDNRIVVGAYGDDTNGSASGSAYIFDLEGNQLTKILASDGAADDNFGSSVAIGNGRIVIGSYQDDDVAASTGSVYIYDLNGNELKKLTANDAVSYNYFGYSVAVGSGRIVVGSYGDNPFSNDSGSAYLYDLEGNLLKKIVPTDGAAGDRFGYSVAVKGGRIVVGAYQDDDQGNLSGGAYLFDIDGNQLAKLIPSDGGPGHEFGYSVSASHKNIAITARGNTDNAISYVYSIPSQKHFLDILD